MNRRFENTQHENRTISAARELRTRSKFDLSVVIHHLALRKYCRKL